MHVTLCATVLVAAMLATSASAQTQTRVETPSTGTVTEPMAAQSMNEQLARQERAGRRATSGICDGCTPGTRTGRRRVEPHGIIGEDGLAYRPEDLR
jgi:hypothetical protein